MNVERIKALISGFSNFKETDNSPPVFWEMTQIFKDNWDLNKENSDLPAMFNSSVHSNYDRSIWKRPGYYPKEMMELFFKNYPDYCKQAFKELFDSNLDLGLRTDRFKFYCDELLANYKKDHPKSVENNHYHDTEMVGFYLFLYDPEENPLYKLGWFKSICELTLARPIPETHDIDRYYKISKILKKFLQQESELSKLYESEVFGLKLNFCKPMDSYIPLADFYSYCAAKLNHN